MRCNLARLYAVAGEIDRSLDALEEALRAGFGNRAWVERDPDLEALRSHPRLRALVAAG